MWFKTLIQTVLLKSNKLLSRNLLMYSLIHLGNMFCPEVSQILVIPLCFSRFLPSCSLLFSGGVRCWALALLLSPSHLLCTCSFVSTVVCLDFSLGCRCKETASCRIMLRQPERGRHQPRDPGELLSTATVPSPASPSRYSRRLIPLLRLFALLLLLAPLGPRNSWAAPSWPHQAAGGVGVSGRRAGALKTPWQAALGQPSFSRCRFCIRAGYSLHHVSPGTSRLLSRARPLAPPAGKAIFLAPKPAPGWLMFDDSTKGRCLDG